MYVLLLEQIERQVLADRHVVAVLMAAGQKGLELPDYETKKRMFDRALEAEPRLVSDDDAVVLEALGVRRAG